MMLGALLSALLALALCSAGQAPDSETHVEEMSAVCLMQRKHQLGPQRGDIDEHHPHEAVTAVTAENSSSADTDNAAAGDETPHGVNADKAAEATNDGTLDEKVALASAESLALRMVLELRPSLSALHKSSVGPIPEFLRNLRSELCASAGLPQTRLSLLGVRGEYFSMHAYQVDDPAMVEAALLSEQQPALLSESQNSSQPDPAMAKMQHEKTGKNGPAALKVDHKKMASFVDLEVLPAERAGDPVPSQVLAFWQGELQQATSSLRTGTLKSVMEDAVLTAGGAVGSRTLGGDGQSAAAPAGRLWLCSLALGVGLLRLQQPGF